MTQTTVTLTVTVKGDRDRAEREVTRRMNEWFTETTRSDCVEGFGFPEGTSLYWRTLSIHEHSEGRVTQT